MRAEKIIDESRLQVDPNRLLWPGVDVSPLPMHVAAGQLGYQRRGTPRAGQRQLGRQGALEASGGLGAQAQRSRRLADARSVEVRRLEQDVGRLPGDGRLLASDHAGDGDRALRVRDDEHFRRELSLHTIEAEQLFLRAGSPDVDLGAGQLIQVERVQRLGVLQQHVVGCVDDVVDGPHTARAQSPLHPFGARPHLDALDHATDVPAAQVWIVDRDLDQIPAGRVGGARERGHEVALHRPVESRPELARHAEMAHLVRAVGGDLRLHDRLAGNGRG